MNRHAKAEKAEKWQLGCYDIGWLCKTARATSARARIPSSETDATCHRLTGNFRFSNCTSLALTPVVRQTEVAQFVSVKSVSVVVADPW
jgi:hypothetical protein